MSQLQEKKKARQARVPRRNTLRRWCVPPAILQEGEEALEGTGILEEVRGESGLLLWQSLRDVMLWASVDPERRGGLFTGDAVARRLRHLHGTEVDPQLEVSLTALAALVGNPGETHGAVVTLVCLQVARWAEERGAPATALWFAQAGALASPDDAEAALAVGRVALRTRRYSRAETWLRRTIGLGRRAGDWGAYAAGYVELGNLYARRGSADLARRGFVKGMRSARRHGLITVRGQALHGLFLLALEAGEVDDAERYARGAMRAYGRGGARYAELVHDVAYLWVLRESWERAIPLLQRILPTRVEPRLRVVTLAVLARAAAGAGDRPLYQEAWSEAWSLVLQGVGSEAGGRALLELARAAAALRDWPRMEQAVRQALASSTRPEPRLAAQLEEVAAARRRAS